MWMLRAQHAAGTATLWCFTLSTLPPQSQIAGAHNFEEDLIKYYWKDGAARSEYHHLVGD